MSWERQLTGSDRVECMKPDRWIVIDGSIFTERLHPVKIKYTGKIIMDRKSIAFNVGHLAKYIVDLHNQFLVSTPSET